MVNVQGLMVMNVLACMTNVLGFSLTSPGQFFRNPGVVFFPLVVGHFSLPSTVCLLLDSPKTKFKENIKQYYLREQIKTLRSMPRQFTE